MSLHSDQPRDRFRPRVFFYVQHLLGTGHVKRAALIAVAMRELGLDIHLISGGAPTPGLPDTIRLVQLPALSASDQSFKQLIDEAGNPIDESWKSSRRRTLLDRFLHIAPDVVIIESFPFGRRQLRFELLPLLDAIREAKPRPLLLCSVRDIVQVRPARRLAETLDTLRLYFDGVMVHADPTFVELEESFPPAADIAHMIQYTGYVAPVVTRGGPDGAPSEVIVSAGGGAVGDRLLRTAIQARRLSRHRGMQWRILVGPHASQQVFETLQKQAGGESIVERNRSDFRSLLDRCRVSVSQAGYNTIMDVLSAGIPAVIVPFVGEGETEQTLRARKLEQMGRVEVITEKRLSPLALAAAIDRNIAKTRIKTNPLNMAGAAESARFVMDRWRCHTR